MIKIYFFLFATVLFIEALLLNPRTQDGFINDFILILLYVVLILVGLCEIGSETPDE